MTDRATLKIDAGSWWRLPREMRFLMAGAYNTAFGYAVFVLLFFLLDPRVPYLWIALLCFPISLTSAFIVHRTLVFSSKEPWLPSFFRFNVSQLAAFLFGMVGLYTLVHFGRVQPLVAQALVLAASVFISYALHRHFSFRDQR